MSRGRGFWSSFQQGLQVGDQLTKQFEEAQRRRDIKDAASFGQSEESQYSPDQANAIQNAADNGGVTYDPAKGGYVGADGVAITPVKQYRLGNQTSSTSFTPDEIRDARAERMAQVYDKYDPEKAAQLRSANQTLKLGKVQYDNAERQAEEAKNLSAIMKLHQARGTMSDDELMSKLVDLTDPMNKDGLTHGVSSNGDGTYTVVQMKDNHIVGQKVVTPDYAFREAMKYASPTMFSTMLQQQNADREFGFKAGRAAVDDSHWNQKFKQEGDQFQQGMDYKVAEHNDEMGLKRDQLDIEKDRNNIYREKVNGPTPLNDVQRYQLDQMQKFDAAKGAIIDDLSSGKIDEREAGRRMNMLSLKFGGQMKDPRPEVSDQVRKEAFTAAQQSVMADPKYKTLSKEAQQRVLSEAVAANISTMMGDAAPAPALNFAPAPKIGLGQAKVAPATPQPKSIVDMAKTMDLDQLDAMVNKQVGLSYPLDPQTKDTLTKILNGRRFGQSIQDRSGSSWQQGIGSY